MESARFDAWMKTLAGAGSRRDIVRTLTSGAAGLAASWLSLGGVEAGNRRKKKRRQRKRKNKKRCKRLRESCTPGGMRICCNGLPCDEVLSHPGFSCCKEPGATCSDDRDCCGTHVCEEVAGTDGTICCPGVGSSCINDNDCCGDQTFCDDGTCALCPFPCPAGERCIHGTCTCGSTGFNLCPFEGPMDQCSCGGQTVDGIGATCADKFSACDIDTPCTTHDDCPVGSVCKTTCVDPDNPQGPNRCSNPCVPA